MRFDPDRRNQSLDEPVTASGDSQTIWRTCVSARSSFQVRGRGFCRLTKPSDTSKARRITLAEAQTAIYVDFECLATKRPHPAFLGVVTGGEDHQFEQIIIDERLAPAKVANKRYRFAPAAAAVGELVARADAENRKLVGIAPFSGRS